MLSEMNEKSFLSFSPTNQNKLYLCGQKGRDIGFRRRFRISGVKGANLQEKLVSSSEVGLYGIHRLKETEI